MKGKRVQLVGHTMGTPGYDLEEAAGLFRACGFSGMETVCREGAAVEPFADTAALAQAARRLADRGVRWMTLTPYAWDLESADPKRGAAARELLEWAVDACAAAGGAYVRAYSGREPAPKDREDAWKRAVERLWRVSERARKCGVMLVVENHHGTLTRTGEDTRAFVEAVGSPTAGILYDPANVLCDTDEPWERTFDIQKERIAYVHVKDFRRESDRRKACPAGAGCVPWRSILQALCPQRLRGMLFV
mgnify:CR=1 FL=1